jgi:iron complex outermembrane receptor protein
VERRHWNDVSVGDSREIQIPGEGRIGFNNIDLKWEQTAQTAIGVDFGFLSDRLTGSIDYYNKQTKDLLMQANTAQPAAANFFFKNLDAIVENKGWELSLAYQAINNESSSLTFSGNVSHNKNMVKDFAGVFQAGRIYGQGLSEAYAQQVQQGQPLFSYFLRSFEGFDENGQPISDDVQKFVGKSALPVWNTGFSVNGRFNKFDFAMYWTGQFGQYIYNNTKNAFFTAGSINVARNVTPDVLTSGEAGAAEAAVSERFIEKGDFMRLQNLSLGYTVLKGGAGAIKNLRFSLNGQNLILITGYSGLDPEVSTSAANYQLLNNLPTAGIDYAAYPKPRTFTIGLNATF